ASLSYSSSPVGAEQDGQLSVPNSLSQGPVSFRNGERTAVVELIQFQGDSGVLVGEFNTSNQQVRLMTQLLKFKGPGPAKDQTLVHLQHRQVSLILYTLISSVATGTIFITLIILCIVIISHRH
ncbi:hypothetical protein AMECASPLE_031977, partial [Ameca splendens]